ncbi:acyl-ACP--UDP-N-acetylglucosamine O-acyltransferase [Crocinitomix catalasitica]|uniref:acyl-ACP--UDP-N-acetylglucosamine O-acyltransferase n=1 Tax=Crocinitomix catalasitica TaxID=184607 RepID=UPI000483604A|nr:acyl-ACP--UDP-N-acetylglucosamine O-acyltransferase [Crocinitomix catalasitica]
MISHLANINPGATIGKNVSIQSFTTIYDDVIIGDGTEIGANVTIYSGARIGKNCKIFPGAVISAEPQDLKYGGEYTTTEIGDGTIIRECVTIHRGTNDRKKTVIGDNCLLMCYVHIGHDCLIGNNVIIANSSGISGHVTIEDWAIIEGMCGVQQFVRIGTHAFVAGMTSVRKNVPPFIRAAREPLAYAGINAIGLRRRRISNEKLKMIEDIYRNLYILNNSISSGVSSIESEIPDSDEKKLVLEFIKDSKKGIIKGPL